MDNHTHNLPDIMEPDEKLSKFYSMADEEIPPQERSVLYNEVGTDEHRYSEHVEIAKGGLKRIDKVYDRKTGRHVAFATLREPERKDLVEPFLREGRLTGSLHHPNIIPVYDLGLDEEGNPFFIMELKSGKTLSMILHEHHKAVSKVWKLDDLISIFLKICDAMAYAHSRNILHLDLKPENIQVGEFGEVMICDWGLAKIISTSEDVATEYMETAGNPDLINSITFHGDIKGTPGYMAPEQVSSGTNKTYTSDIYGLGAMLNCMLTGKAPVEGTVPEVLDKTRAGKITAPEQVNPAVPKALSAVAMKAMRLDPEKRYQCVEDLALDIRKYTEGFATTAENAGVLKMLHLLYLRHKTFFISLAGVVAFVATITAVYLVHLSRSREVAVHERKRAEAALARIVEEEKIVAGLRSDIEETSIGKSNQLWREPLHNRGKAKNGFLEAMENLDRALALNPDNELAWAKKGYLCFLMQQYNHALQCLEKGGGLYTPLKDLSIKYGNLKPDDEFLDIEQFAKIAAEVLAISDAREITLEMMLLYDYIGTRGKKNHSQNVFTVLKLMNPEWKEPVFTHNRRQGLVRIGGAGLRRFKVDSYWSSNENMLRTLQVRRLEFLETDFSDSGQLIGLSVGAMDISKTQIEVLDGIRSISSLVQLTVHERQFPEEKMKKLSSGIEVITVK